MSGERLQDPGLLIKVVQFGRSISDNKTTKVL